MAIVQDFMVGPTRIIVRDDYIVKTEEEKQKILDNITRIVNQAKMNEAITRSMRAGV